MWPSKTPRRVPTYNSKNSKLPVGLPETPPDSLNIISSSGSESISSEEDDDSDIEICIANMKRRLAKDERKWAKARRALDRESRRIEGV
jgi:hypothetical protein